MYRGRILQLVRERDPHPVPARDIGPRVFPGFSPSDRPWLFFLLSRLVRERLLTWEEGKRAVRFPT
jgi:hypothetical protein